MKEQIDGRHSEMPHTEHALQCSCHYFYHHHLYYQSAGWVYHEGEAAGRSFIQHMAFKLGGKDDISSQEILLYGEAKHGRGNMEEQRQARMPRRDMSRSRIAARLLPALESGGQGGKGLGGEVKVS